MQLWLPWEPPRTGFVVCSKQRDKTNCQSHTIAGVIKNRLMMRSNEVQARPAGQNNKILLIWVRAVWKNHTSIVLGF